MTIDWKKYIVSLIITIGIFMTAFFLGDFFSKRKVVEIKDIQDSIAIDILSSETQFSLLSELSCQDVSSANLSDELASIAEKIEFTEKNSSVNATKLIELKKYYTLLEIKDFILTRKIAERCGKKISPILYFYTTKDNCSECTRQGYVLSELRARNDHLRVYSFDYALATPALKSLISLYKVRDTELPTLVIGEKKYTGFQDIETLSALSALQTKEK